LRKNLNTSAYLPSSKLDKLQKQSTHNEVRREITQKTKQAILEQVKQRRVEAFEQKFRRFEIRKNMHEVQHISSSWFTVNVVIGSLYVWQTKAHNRLVKDT
jgi:L-ribulose-5-phosphate 3-epimerase UlaE